MTQAAKTWWGVHKLVLPSWLAHESEMQGSFPQLLGARQAQNSIHSIL